MFFILICVVVGHTQMTQSSALVQGYMNKKVQLLDQIIERTDELKRLHELFPHDGSPSEQAVYCRDKLKEQMLAVREVTDQAEKVVTHTVWPFPKYDDILYIHHPESDNNTAADTAASSSGSGKLATRLVEVN